MSTLVRIPAAALVLAALGGPLAPGARAQVTERVSVGASCVQGNADSSRPALSADGNAIVFYSDASNLVSGDANSMRDIFVRERAAASTTLVSVASDGTQANGPSNRPAVSADGRFVAFLSDADNLVAGDTNHVTDVFLRDLATGTTTRVSVSSSGTQANGPSAHPAISSDGRFIAFDSSATNLVAGDTNGFSDVFLHDRAVGVTIRVSLSSSGQQGNHDSTRPALSADGSIIAFKSRASNLVAGDTNAFSDIFARDRIAGTTTRVSVRSNGDEADEDSFYCDLSDDGRYVVFSSLAGSIVPGDFNNFIDIFVHDRVTAETVRMSESSAGAQSDGDSDLPSISGDGRQIVFRSLATNLVAGDTNLAMDIFLHDRITGETSRVSVNSAGAQVNAESDRPAISGDGGWIAFRSPAGNFVAGDTNGWKDVFLAPRGYTALMDCQGIDGENVLFVNGQTGAANGYRVQLSSAASITLSMLLPSGGGRGKYVVHLNPGDPDASTVTPLPAALGSMCFPILIPPFGSANPSSVWNNIGKTAKIGSSNWFGSPIADPPRAPADFLLLPSGDPAHLPACTRWTLQGIIHNPNASSPRKHSVTNAVAVNMVP